MRDKERNLRGAPAHRLAHIQSFDHYGNRRALGTGREPHLAHLVPGDNSRSPSASLLAPYGPGPESTPERHDRSSPSLCENDTPLRPEFGQQWHGGELWPYLKI